MPQLAQLVCDTYEDANTGKPTFSCDDLGTAGFDAISPADLPPVEIARDGSTTAPVLGERAAAMAHYADQMAVNADVGAVEYNAALREMIQDNPELLRVMPLTDEGIRNLLDSGMTYESAYGGLRSGQADPGREFMGHRQDGLMSEAEYAENGQTDYREAIELLDAVGATHDPYLEARFLRIGTEYLGEGQRRHDGRDELIGGDNPVAQMWDAQTAGRDYTDFREGLLGLALDNPDEVIRQMRTSNTRVSQMVEHTHLGDSPDGDATGDAMTRLLTDVIQPCPRDAEGTTALDLTTQLFSAVRNPGGDADGGDYAFGHDQGVAGNLGYLAGAGDRALAESEANDAVLANAFWKLGTALVPGGEVGSVVQSALGAGQEVGVDAIVDLCNDDDEALGPLATIIRPERADTTIDAGGAAFESFDQQYENVRDKESSSRGRDR